MSRGFAISFLLAAVVTTAHAPAQATEEAASIAGELEAIRDSLVALNIERALAALNEIVERPGLTDAQRVEALDLRAQAHAANDDLARVEKDFRAILEIKPDYVPERAVTSKKAMTRYVKLQAAMIGTLQLSVDPKDATLAVDGRPVLVSPEGTLKVVAGERRLRLTRLGFDTLETTAQAVAGQETLLKLQMIPNARTLVVRTDVEGVAVALDGAAVGVTARKADSGPGAELVVENAAIGEHELQLTKTCYAGETLHEIVTADLSDRSPKVLREVVMRPARTHVKALGATYGGELRVDGERVASMPLTSFAMCPGDRKIEAVTSGRVVWLGRIAAEEADVTLDLTPRPTAAMVSRQLPAAWSAVEAGLSIDARLPVPAGVDLATSAGWRGISLPPGADVAFAMIPSQDTARDGDVVMYSPALHQVEVLASPPAVGRPSWRRATIGSVLVEDGSGAVLIASVAPGGPAALSGLTAGDRLISVAGLAVATAAAANEAVERAGPNVTLLLEVASPGGAPRRIECVTASEIRLAPTGAGSSRVLLAAWSAVDAAVAGPDGPVALASLARLLDEAGQDAAAFDAWRRVQQSGNEALAGRAAYAVGAGLQARGKQKEAIEAFSQARGHASARGDIAIAAAAGDRLADLGVAER